MNTVQLVIPMSGQGRRFLAAGYTMPKPMVPVAGVPMIERVLACFPYSWPATFILASNHISSGLPELLQRLRPGCRLVFVEPHSRGPGYALEAALPFLDSASPVFVSYCDYGMAFDSAQFEKFVRDSGCDACIVTYRGFHAHYLSPNTYAYARLQGERVVEVREKGSFTNNREDEHASAGGYFFASAELLRRSLEAQKELNLFLGGEAYISLTVQALLATRPDAHVRVFEVPIFFQWGTPEDVRTFDFFDSTMRTLNRSVGRRLVADQVLLPMAGRGVRFHGITRIEKPLIPVAGRPMYQVALDYLPKSERTVVVTLKHIASKLSPGDGVHVISLSEVLPGQALSVQAGLSELEPSREVVVGACDHALALDINMWEAFRANPRCDAAIFVVRGLPAAVRNPASFAWVVPEQSSERFPRVLAVSVKQPISETPWQDYVLVGSFYFATAAVLSRGIEELVRMDRRVNGELYLDSVFELIISSGGVVKMIPLDGCLSFGDPDSLAEALYYIEAMGGRRPWTRPRWPGIAE